MKSLISFFEIPAIDFGRAVKFYESVLKLKLTAMDCETEKMAFFPEENGLCLGAISFAENFKPSGSQSGVLISLNVDDMEDSLRKVKENGGRIVREKTKIEAEGRGYFSLFIDSEGNQLGLYSDK